MNKVARGEQATRPSRENLSVSIAPPPSSTNTKVAETEKGPTADEKFLFSDEALRCFTSYLEYHKKA
ncbi:unnamed protein product [Ilex paraguariensis]|uniref:Uncharacterized protein n=1 Tax=Ilex paraguariensis TaxID=185542 RepID=A0ABC8TZQ5_9AQUA